MSSYNELISKSKFFKQVKELTKETSSPVQLDKSKEKLIKLNIGAGPNVFPSPGWISYDREDISDYFNFIKTTVSPEALPGHVQKLSAYLKNGGEINCNIHDLRKPFIKHPDDTVDVIYVGQAIEHLNIIYEVPAFLKECYRMLKSGGLLRMTTPDLDLLIKAYTNGEMAKFADEQPAFYKEMDPSAQLAMIMYGAVGHNCTFEHYEGHFFLFTQKSMTNVLEKAGFRSIKFYYETGKSIKPEIANEFVDLGMTHSFIVECVK